VAASVEYLNCSLKKIKLLIIIFVKFLFTCRTNYVLQPGGRPEAFHGGRLSVLKNHGLDFAEGWEYISEVGIWNKSTHYGNIADM
jgi:hypothetical protein